MAELDIERSRPRRSIVAIVPTMGRSCLLERCLRRLKSQEMVVPEVMVISQGSEIPEASRALADRVIHLDENLGFAAACNLAINETNADLVAIVNDDAIVERNWLVSLSRHLQKDSAVSSAQGVNLSFDHPDIIDGCGIAWNTFWRPVQIGKGLPRNTAGESVRPVLGVSGTAALYRQEALAKVARSESHYFDPYLVSFYEDVDLSIRLHRQGFTALFVPRARVLHQGGATSRTFAHECERLRYRNRYLVLAQMSGKSFHRRATLLFPRDVLSIVALALAGKFRRALGACRGLAEAVEAIPGYRHRDPSIEMKGLLPVRIRRAACWPQQWSA